MVRRSPQADGASTQIYPATDDPIALQNLGMQDPAVAQAYALGTRIGKLGCTVPLRALNASTQHAATKGMPPAGPVDPVGAGDHAKPSAQHNGNDHQRRDFFEDLGALMTGHRDAGMDGNTKKRSPGNTATYHAGDAIDREAYSSTPASNDQSANADLLYSSTEVEKAKRKVYMFRPVRNQGSAVQGSGRYHSDHHSYSFEKRDEPPSIAEEQRGKKFRTDQENGEQASSSAPIAHDRHSDQGSVSPIGEPEKAKREKCREVPVRNSSGVTGYTVKVCPDSPKHTPAHHRGPPKKRGESSDISEDELSKEEYVDAEDKRSQPKHSAASNIHPPRLLTRTYLVILGLFVFLTFFTTNATAQPCSSSKSATAPDVAIAKSRADLRKILDDSVLPFESADLEPFPALRIERRRQANGAGGRDAKSAASTAVPKPGRTHLPSVLLVFLVLFRTANSAPVDDMHHSDVTASALHPLISARNPRPRPRNERRFALVPSPQPHRAPTVS